MKHSKRRVALLLVVAMVVSSTLGVLGIPHSRGKKVADRKGEPQAEAAAYTPEPTEAPVEWKAIEDAGDLYAIREDLEGHYYLANDIDLSEVTAKGGDYDFGNGWEPIEGFKGQLDGRGYRIKGMHIFGEMNNRNVGLFGKTENAVFCNLGMVDCNINVSGANNVGSIVGHLHMKGRITSDDMFSNCYSLGQIIVNNALSARIGGLIGRVTYGYYVESYLNYILTNCYNACTISCNTLNQCKIGGLVGGTYYNSSWNSDEDCPSRVCLTFDTCYNVGMLSVDGENLYVGSILGYGETDGQYTTGYTYYINCNSLFDTAEFEQGMGTIKENSTHKFLTATQMKTQKLFTGFDFDTTWEFDPFCGYDYPQLQANRQVRATALKVTPAETAPEGLVYPQGFELAVDGWKLEVMYEKMIGDPVLLPLTSDMIGGFDMDKIGGQSVTVSYAGFTTTFDIEVIPVEVTGVRLDKTELQMYRGDTYQMEASVIPDNATNQEIIWTSSDDNIVSVDESGLLTARKRGTVVITATAADNEEIQADCRITVEVAASTLTLSKTEMTLDIGQSQSITAALLPLDATEAVQWRSGDEDVIQVQTDDAGNAIVLAVGGGEAVVSASTAKNHLVKSCEVTVHGGEETSKPTKIPTIKPTNKPNTGLQTFPAPQKTVAPGKTQKPADDTTHARYIRTIKQYKLKIVQCKNVKKRTVKVKVKGAGAPLLDGYQIQYSLKSNMKSAKTRKHDKYDNKVTFRNLKKKKTYYIRVRCYGTVAGKTYYGKWSAKKKVKIKK